MHGSGGPNTPVGITGSGSLAGVPISDHRGNTFIQVACEGSPFFVGRSDWATTGSPEADPPHAGLITMKVSATIYAPPPEDYPGYTGPGSGIPGTTPGGPPGGGTGPKKFLWDWRDLNTNPTHAADAPGVQAGEPTSIGEWEAKFFGWINRTKGTPANDFSPVMAGLVGQGMVVNPPRGQVPQQSWPFYGMTMMMSGGEPRGRIWLPANGADGLGYWTKEFQVIRDDPNQSASNESAPNRMNVVTSVQNRKTWNLSEANAANPDGRGAFVEEVVMAMHDTDARWGHLKKDPGQTQYRGHATDSVNFKNDDGTTAEVFQIVTGSTTSWTFISRSDTNRPRWYYPA